MRIARSCFIITVCALLAQTVSATMFVVPADREMVRRAHAIVVGSALTSYSQLNEDGGIETVTPVSIEEVIKGGGFGSVINVVEPGGEYKGRVTIIAGVPRFEEGKRMLLMLTNTGHDRWAVTELVLGKFTFESDRLGQKLLVRDEAEIVGWDPDLSVHREQHRAADRFLHFVRNQSAGSDAPTDYTVTSAPLVLQPTANSVPLTPSTNIAPYTATSYTMNTGGSQGSRWTVFPAPVTWFRGQTGEAGAPNNGDAAIAAAFNSWNNDCGSNVNYVYAGVDNGTHTQGLHAADGANTILFEQDLSAWGVTPFACSSNSYGGTLGLGGITSASGSNSVNGETFLTTKEADVMMNRGIANCTLLFSNGDFNSAVTHEVGHTLSFRHSDQNRASNAACSSDPSLECSSSAIMTAVVTPRLNAALQAWDQHAVQAVYPGNVCSPTSTPVVASPTGLSATAISASQINLNWSYNGTASIFNIERRMGTSGAWLLITQVGGTLRSYSNAPLPPCTTFYYRISAITTAGTSAPSNEASATTSCAAVAAPTGLTATAVSPTQINLAWSYSGTAAAFNIERRLGTTGSWLLITQIPGNLRTYANAPLPSCTTFYYRISAITSSGTSSPSNEASATTSCGTVAAPTGLTATAVSNNQINLAWSYSGTAAQFNIERRTSTGAFVLITQVSGTLRTYSNAPLPSCTTFVYRISAITTSGTSVPSNEATATTSCP